MPPFDDLDLQGQLRALLKEWQGTPYRHRCGVKNLGVDCIHFVARVLEELGFLHWRKDLIPDYNRDWHLHSDEERLKKTLEKELRVQMIDLSEIQTGDILLLHFGRACAHAAIACDGFAYHAINGAGVVNTSLKDRKLRRRVRFAYRIMP